MMDMGYELGLVKPGYLADLLVVRGNPIENIKLFQDRDNLVVIMKDGVYHKAPTDAGNGHAAVGAARVKSVWE